MQALSPIDWTGSWFVPWAQTPGFGGVAAVIAATIAFAASRYQARVQRSAQRKEQWWKRAEWALNLTLSDDRTRSEIGIAVLEALASSEWAGEHEDEVISAALSGPIAPPESNMILPHIHWDDHERSHDARVPTDTPTEPGAV
ncbi:hypothetical protein ACEXQE_00550 [Herbiconiux sp. P17]|uniref:hypothetical protein n=1 Tax=Herbiconiux wuyangfengii TaxID=3342794 RepID=UPI0035B6C636